MTFFKLLVIKRRSSIAYGFCNLLPEHKKSLFYTFEFLFMLLSIIPVYFYYHWLVEHMLIGKHTHACIYYSHIHVHKFIFCYYSFNLYGIIWLKYFSSYFWQDITGHSEYHFMLTNCQLQWGYLLHWCIWKKALTEQRESVFQGLQMNISLSNQTLAPNALFIIYYTTNL